MKFEIDEQLAKDFVSHNIPNAERLAGFIEAQLPPQPPKVGSKWKRKDGNIGELIATKSCQTVGEEFVIWYQFCGFVTYTPNDVKTQNITEVLP